MQSCTDFVQVKKCISPLVAWPRSRSRTFLISDNCSAVSVLFDMAKGRGNKRKQSQHRAGNSSNSNKSNNSGSSNKNNNAGKGNSSNSQLEKVICQKSDNSSKEKPPLPPRKSSAKTSKVITKSDSVSEKKETKSVEKSQNRQEIKICEERKAERLDLISWEKYSQTIKCKTLIDFAILALIYGSDNNMATKKDTANSGNAFTGSWMGDLGRSLFGFLVGQSSDSQGKGQGQRQRPPTSNATQRSTPVMVRRSLGQKSSRNSSASTLGSKTSLSNEAKKNNAEINTEKCKQPVTKTKQKEIVISAVPDDDDYSVDALDKLEEFEQSDKVDRDNVDVKVTIYKVPEETKSEAKHIPKAPPLPPILKLVKPTEETVQIQKKKVVGEARASEEDECIADFMKPEEDFRKKKVAAAEKKGVVATVQADSLESTQDEISGGRVTSGNTQSLEQPSGDLGNDLKEVNAGNECHNVKEEEQREVGDCSKSEGGGDKDQSQVESKMLIEGKNLVEKTQEELEDEEEAKVLCKSDSGFSDAQEDKSVSAGVSLTVSDAHKRFEKRYGHQVAAGKDEDIREEEEESDVEGGNFM